MYNITLIIPLQQHSSPSFRACRNFQTDLKWFKYFEPEMRPERWGAPEFLVATALMPANGWSKLWWMRRQNYDKPGLHLTLVCSSYKCFMHNRRILFSVFFSFFIFLVLIKHCFMLSLPKFKVVPYFIFYFDPIKTEIVLFVLIPIKYRPNFDFNSQPLLLAIFRLHSWI